MRPTLFSLLLEGDPWVDPQVPWEQIFDELEQMGILDGGDEERYNESSPRSFSMLLMDDAQARIILIAKQFEVDPDKVAELLPLDPSGGKCLTWIVKQVKAGNLTMPEDADKTRETLTTFMRLKNKAGFQGEKDLNKYADFAALWGVVETNSEVKSKGEMQRELQTKGVRCLAGDRVFGIYEVTTAEAGAKLFRDTGWCVKDPKFFNRYKPSTFCMFVKAEKPFALYHEATQQLKNKGDGAMGIKLMYQFVDMMAQAGLLPALAELPYRVDDLNRVIYMLALIKHGDEAKIDVLKKKLGLDAVTSEKGSDSELVGLLRKKMRNYGLSIPQVWYKRYGEDRIKACIVDLLKQTADDGNSWIRDFMVDAYRLFPETVKPFITFGAMMKMVDPQIKRDNPPPPEILEMARAALDDISKFDPRNVRQASDRPGVLASLLTLVKATGYEPEGLEDFVYDAIALLLKDREAEHELGMRANTLNAYLIGQTMTRGKVDERFEKTSAALAKASTYGPGNMLCIDQYTAWCAERGYRNGVVDAYVKGRSIHWRDRLADDIDNDLARIIAYAKATGQEDILAQINALLIQPGEPVSLWYDGNGRPGTAVLARTSGGKVEVSTDGTNYKSIPKLEVDGTAPGEDPEMGALLKPFYANKGRRSVLLTGTGLSSRLSRPKKE